MLKIRLQRVGRVHEPVYRLVLTDSKNGPKSGKVLEVLGSFDSRASEKAQIKGDQAVHWLSKGAQASDTAHNLLLKLGIIKGERRNILPKKIIEAAKVKAAPVAEPAPVEVVAEPVAETPATPEEEVKVEEKTETV
jgi:small subunit ribosomal protein S16